MKIIEMVNLWRICFDIELDNGDVNFEDSIYEKISLGSLFSDKNKLKKLLDKVKKLPDSEDYSLEIDSKKKLEDLLNQLFLDEIYSSGIIDVMPAREYSQAMKDYWASYRD